VHDAVVVRVLEGQRGLSRDPDGLLERQLMLTPDPIAQALPFDERHREPQLTARRLTGIVDGKDVRVLETGRELDLTRESFSAKRSAEIWAQHLERNLTLVTQIGREIDRCHPPTAELALDRVPAGKRRGEFLFRRCGQ
jgi:hypothetical protein